jgi:hypothetical protein
MVFQIISEIIAGRLEILGIVERDVCKVDAPLGSRAEERE